VCSYDVEQLLELETALPVFLGHLVTEMRLEVVNGVTGDHRDDLRGVVEVTAVRDAVVVNNLDRCASVLRSQRSHRLLLHFD